MHKHIVFFWLVNGDADAADFEMGLKGLLSDPDVANSTFGRPAGTEVRGVVEASYTYGMVADFIDSAAHDRYQVSDIHKKFIADCAHLWSRVQVFDIQV